MDKITERLAMDIARKLIKKHEGFKDRVYVDTMGVPTGGWGHAFLHHSWLPTYIWDLIFDVDFDEARRTAERLMVEYEIPVDIGLPRKIVLVDMAFNLGYDKLRKFRGMFGCLKNKDYEGAAEHMEGSLWASQVGSHAIELSKIMKDGNFPNVSNNYDS